MKFLKAYVCDRSLLCKAVLIGNAKIPNIHIEYKTEKLLRASETEVDSTKPNRNVLGLASLDLYRKTNLSGPTLGKKP